MLGPHMSTGTNFPVQTAPHQVYCFSNVQMAYLIERLAGMLMVTLAMKGVDLFKNSGPLHFWNAPS